MSEKVQTTTSKTSTKAAPKLLSSDLTTAINQIRAILDSAEEDATKVQFGVKSAGTRFRTKIRSINNIVKTSIKRSIELRDAAK
jgi:hypothetical protein